jgi:hypothetical protein
MLHKRAVVGHIFFGVVDNSSNLRASETFGTNLGDVPKWKISLLTIK